MRTAQEAKKRTEPTDHKIANLRGRVAKTGKRKKQMTKHAAAARLQPPKTSRRSHLLNANHPSSSSLLVGAGSGAPGTNGSCVGNCTYPPLVNGFRDDNVERKGVVELVLAGASDSLRDQPSELIELRKEVEAMLWRLWRK